MRRLLLAAAWCLCALLCSAVGAMAGGVRDLADAWLLTPGALANLMPAGTDTTPGAAGAWMAVEGGRLYELSSLPQSRIRAGCPVGRLRCSATWSRLGADLYREDAWSLRVGAGGAGRVALRAGRRRIVLGGDGAIEWAEVVLEVSGGVAPGIDGRIRVPLRGAPGRMAERRVERALELAGRARNLGWSLVVDRSPDGPTVQAAAMVSSGDVLAVGLCAEPSTGTIGLTTAWRRGSLLIRSSHLTHPRLGTSHRWSLGWGGWREVDW